jgi:hypothetical protein
MRRDQGVETRKETRMVYIVLWLLGVPLVLIILLWLVGIGR